MAGGAELVAHGEAVNLDDDAVDLVVDLVALSLPRSAEREYVVQRRRPGGGGIHR